jgi:hypothetical protein
MAPGAIELIGEALGFAREVFKYIAVRRRFVRRNRENLLQAKANAKALAKRKAERGDRWAQ